MSVSTTEAAASTLAASVSTTEAAASPSVASVSTAEATTSPSVASVFTPAPTSVPSTALPSTALPSRRALRQQPRASRSGAVGRSGTGALTLRLPSMRMPVSSARALPVTAIALVACLVVSVATPQSAVASGAPTALPALDVQEFTAATSSSAVAERDPFSIGRVPVPAAAVRPAARTTTTDGATRPVAGTIPAAGGFGSRSVRGCAACSTSHQGLDFAAPTGTAVLAALPGRVVSAGVSGGYGNQVLVEHADGVLTRYGHLSRIGVRAGQTVTSGALLGAVGSTGVSTGPHLHFEVIVGGTPVDPAAWLRAQGLL